MAQKKPEWAETLSDTEEIYSQYTMDNVNGASKYKGSVAIMTGVRASESLVRYRSVVNALHDNYISQSPANTRVKLCKPIYDWEVDDVFKYFSDSDTGIQVGMNHNCGQTIHLELLHHLILKTQRS